MTTLVGGIVAALVAGFVKGTIAFGFPTIGTPLLALFVDVRLAVAVLVPPNIVLDSIQVLRGGGASVTVRRFAVLLVFGAVGTILGTHLLIVLPPRVAAAILGVFLLCFVALNVSGIRLSVPAGWERRLAPPVGLLAGVVGGITNVPGPPLVLYFIALGMPKAEFVRSVALTFIVYKAVQLGALVWYGAFTVALVPAAAGVTLVALGAFALGLKVQDRLDQRTFNRAVLVFIGALGTWLVFRASL